MIYTVYNTARDSKLVGRGMRKWGEGKKVWTRRKGRKQTNIKHQIRAYYPLEYCVVLC